MIIHDLQRRRNNVVQVSASYVQIKMFLLDPL